MKKATLAVDTSADRRKKRRYFVTGVGRLVAPFADVECYLFDMSERGARVKAEVNVRVDDLVALEIEGIGCVRGHVIRAEEDEVAIEFDLDQPHRRRLSERIRGFILGCPDPGRAGTQAPADGNGAIDA